MTLSRPRCHPPLETTTQYTLHIF
uniref:Uncharacterized protein n=1 Tax=Rhizophora mucronata TaxID=61149 RepID=A0A2P2J7L8_RHIMU